MTLPESLSVSLGLTLAVELPLARALGVKRGRDLLFVLLANLATNPAVVYLYTLSCLRAPGASIFVLAALELAAFAAEGLSYTRCLEEKKPRPYPLSLALNAASFAAGELLTRLL